MRPATAAQLKRATCRTALAPVFAPVFVVVFVVAFVVVHFATAAAAQDWRPFDDTAVQRYEPPRDRRSRPAPQQPAEPAPSPLEPYGRAPPWGGAAPLDRTTGPAWDPATDPSREPAYAPAAGPPAAGQREPARADRWAPPFPDRGAAGRPPWPPGQPPPGAGSPPGAPGPSYQSTDLGPVERTDLPPVMAGDGSGLPHEFWRGLDLPALEKHLAALALPPRSAAMAALWRKLLLAEVADPAGGRGAPFLAVRVEALHRSGLVADEERLLAAVTEDAASPIVTAMRARAEIGAGRAEAGCATARSLSARIEAVPEGLRGEILLFAGYCSAVAQDAAGAGLAAELAREAGLGDTLGLRVLDAIAATTRPRLDLPRTVTLTEYRLMEIAGLADVAAILPRADPALLAVLARDEGVEPRLRIAAAEAAARHHALDAAGLAAVYRTLSAAGGDPTRADPAVRRAAIYSALLADRNPTNRTRGLRALLDEARRHGLLMPVMTMAAPLVAELQMVPEIGWFAETAIEIRIAAGDGDGARQWVRFAATLDGYGRPGAPGGAGLDHWLVLADIADDRLAGPRGEALPALEQMALRGRLAPEFLHRLATVLDALDYQVPIPLWELMSRTQQPAKGFLPETGVLSELQDAARKKEFGRTVLLAMRTLGPEGAEGAHMIALGDGIRALRRAGLSADARRLAFEALFQGWPRNTIN